MGHAVFSKRSERMRRRRNHALQPVTTDKALELLGGDSSSSRSVAMMAAQLAWDASMHSDTKVKMEVVAKRMKRRMQLLVMQLQSAGLEL